MLSLRRIRLVIGWALRDLSQDLQITFLSVLLIAGLAASPLLLHEIKTSVIEGWVLALEEDPRNRQVTIIGEASVTNDTLQRIADWPETGFVVPEPTVFISASRVTGKSDIPQRLDTLTSREGDPILGQAIAPTDDTATLTRGAADLLNVTTGDTVTVNLQRSSEGQPREYLDIELQVVGIVPENTWPGEIIFLSPARASGIVGWIANAKEGIVPPPGTDPALDHSDTAWRSFRIYSSDLRYVEALRDRLINEEQFEARLDTDQVSRLLNLSDALSLLSFIVLLSATLVFALMTGLLQWLAMIRKRREIALMSAAGLSFQDISVFFVIQAFVVTAFGLALSLLSLIPAQNLANRLSNGIADLPADPVRDYLPVTLAGLTVLFLVAALTALVMQQLRKLDIARLLRGD